MSLPLSCSIRSGTSELELRPPTAAIHFAGFDMAADAARTAEVQR